MVPALIVESLSETFSVHSAASSKVSEQTKQNVYTIEPCLLPSLPSTNLSTPEVLSIPVISPSCLDREVEKSGLSRRSILEIAWALLLRSYLLTHRVSFILFTDASGSERVKEIVDAKWQLHSEADYIAPRITSRLATMLEPGVLNTALAISAAVNLEEDNLDFVVQAGLQDARANISLEIRASNVSEPLGRAIAETFRELIIAVGDQNISALAGFSVSQMDRARIASYIPRKPLDCRRCLHHLFQDSARAIPDAEAICAWDGSATYREVDNLSDSVARRLLASGVKVGQYVPFCFEKSMWAVVAVLGIIKAGAAFVPLDPSQPVARIHEIVEDVSADLVVASASQSSLFHNLSVTTVVVSADTTTSQAPQEGDVALPKTTPTDAVFVLFTSGSTGKPKGMVHEHGDICAHTIGHGKELRWEGARALQFSAHTWDVFVIETFTTWTFRGCVCIPSEEDRKFNINDVFNNLRVDLAMLTPSFVNLLDYESIPTLKTLAVGGEALKAETVKRWQGAHKVWCTQMYGPAEVGICIVGDQSFHGRRPETLGYATDNAVCVLVDPENPQRLVPVGAIGELLVGGPSIAREYLNNPAKNATSFLENPAWAQDLKLPAQRFYRTGDLLRYSVDSLDGCFDFVGRRDSQVKYHGQRLELEHVEHHVSNMPTVSNCMVTLPKDGAYKGKLLAIIEEQRSNDDSTASESLAPSKSTKLTLEEVQAYSRKHLPKHAIPNALIVVERLPFTLSMKLDRTQTNKWVANLKTSADEDVSKLKLEGEPLAVHELTAIDISKEYARLMDVSGDEALRDIYEGNDFGLQAGGIDSVQIISLSMFLKKRYGIRPPTRLVLSSKTTIRDLAEFIDSKGQARKTVPTLDEVGLWQEVETLEHALLESPSPVSEKGVPMNVLLTGASGFLGIEILRQLLLRPDVVVHVLIRAASVDEGRARMIGKAMIAGWWSEDVSSRLKIWLGDLSKADLGMSQDLLLMLQGQTPKSESIHAVVHNGARVHYTLDYASLKETNVDSTLDLLKHVMARPFPLSSFVYVSGGQQLSFGEEDDTANMQRLDRGSGYARSKLYSELVVKRCATKEPFVDSHLEVVKPGYIIGSARDGVANTTDFIWRYIAACVEIGGYNAEDSSRWLFMAGVDRVASEVTSNVFGHKRRLVTKVVDGIRLERIWAILRSEFGFLLKGLPRDAWLQRLQQSLMIKQEAHVMFPLMHMVESDDWHAGVEGGPQCGSQDVEDAVVANVRYLIERGFMPRPSPANITTNNNAWSEVKANGYMSGHNAVELQKQGDMIVNVSMIRQDGVCT